MLLLVGCGSPGPSPSALPDAAADPAEISALPWGLGALGDPGPGGRSAARAAALFQAADLDGDGVLTPSEVEAHAAARFTVADLNGDGQLDRAELGLSGLPPEAQTLPFDTDGNGRMSQAEHLAYIRTVISQTSDDGSPLVEWVDIDRRLVR